MIDKLIEYISQFIPIGKEEIKVISSMVEVKEYKKGHTLLEEGMISRVSYFNLQGCVRLYYLVDGEEKTTFFFHREPVHSFNEEFYQTETIRPLFTVCGRL